MNEALKPLNFDPFAKGIVPFVEAMIKKALQQFQTCIPAIVQKVIDRNTVVATPAVQQVDSQWVNVPWAAITLPVHTPCGGGVSLTCPVAVGDTGWIIAGDLDPSLFFKDTTQPARQNTLDRHEYQFGFFMPSNINGVQISDDDAGALVITTADGGTKIAIKDGKINITSSAELNINAETVNITGSTQVVINGTDWASHTHTVPADIPVVVGGNSGATTATAQTGGVD